MNNNDYKEIVKLSDHYKAIGQTSIWLYNYDNRLDCYPWEYAVDVKAGGSYRLNGPASFKVIAEHPCGIRFEWCIDLEERDANGRAINLFDIDKLRRVVTLLPKVTQGKFANFLRSEVLHGVRKITNDLRETLDTQVKAADLLYELIDYIEYEG